MFWVLAVLLFVTGGLASRCTLFYEPSYPLIFLQKFGSNNTFISTEGVQLHFDDGLPVTAYCPTNFKNLEIKGPRTYEDDYKLRFLKQITFSCEDSHVMLDKSELQNDGNLSCPETSQYYERYVPACKYEGLAFGFFIGEQAVVFAEVCYNLEFLQPSFLHYVAGDRSTILENQPTQNVANVTFDFGIFIDDSNLEDEKRYLSAELKYSIPEFAAAVKYELDEFIPLKKSLGILGYYTNDFRSVNVIPWWKPLKFGNWKSVEEAIEAISRDETYDIFAGTSGVVNYPTIDGVASTGVLSFPAVAHDRNLPKYVWNYIRKRNHPDEGVVVIGVNTPFVASSKGDYIICEDICDSISWLSSIKVTRKMAALGHTFCCKPAEVEDKLDNFPVFLN
ncbi:uncharacterized protein LOC119661129 [Hermetia illucens]|uniref:uncharacterized protein LOC119661129 n=1 Tax=Hermetia illucens TaxID=343691 RepID=UPI0018CC74DB|nr:uncharacterized protein LOC119661129 [Hermetia illucens]